KGQWQRRERVSGLRLTLHQLRCPGRNRGSEQALHERMPNKLLKFPIRWTLFQSSLELGLVSAKPVVEPWVRRNWAQDQIGAVEDAQVSRRQPELLEWPAAGVDILPILQPKPYRPFL